MRRNGQPMFNCRSRCRTLTLQPRMAAYTCSSTHAHGTGGTFVKSTPSATLLISRSAYQSPAGTDIASRAPSLRRHRTAESPNRAPRHRGCTVRHRPATDPETDTPRRPGRPSRSGSCRRPPSGVRMSATRAVAVAAISPGTAHARIDFRAEPRSFHHGRSARCPPSQAAMSDSSASGSNISSRRSSVAGGCASCVLASCFFAPCRRMPFGLQMFCPQAQYRRSSTDDDPRRNPGGRRAAPGCGCRRRPSARCAAGSRIRSTSGTGCETGCHSCAAPAVSGRSMYEHAARNMTDLPRSRCSAGASEGSRYSARLYPSRENRARPRRLPGAADTPFPAVRVTCWIIDFRKTGERARGTRYDCFRMILWSSGISGSSIASGVAPANVYMVWSSSPATMK